MGGDGGGDAGVRPAFGGFRNHRDAGVRGVDPADRVADPDHHLLPNYPIDSFQKSKYTMFIKEITVMSFENYFPVWNELNTAQKKLISDNLITQHVKNPPFMRIMKVILINGGSFYTPKNL